MESGASSVRPSPFDSLRHRQWARFALAMTVANSGQFLLGLTTPFLVNELTGSSRWVGAAGFLSLFPAVVGTPIAGALADRLDRRRLLIASYVLLNIVVGVFLVAYLAGELTPWRILGLQLVLGILVGFQFAPIQSMPAVLVPEESLVDAVRFLSIAFTASRALGPAIGGVVLATSGPGLGYGLALACFAIGLLGLLTIQTTQHIEVKARRFTAEVAAGIGYIRARAGMRLAVVSSFVIGLFGACFAFALAPSVAADHFGVGGGGLGALATMIGVGSIAGSIYISRGGGEVLRSRVEMFALATYGVGLVVVGATQFFAVGIVGYLLMGLAHMLHNVSMTTALQVQVEEGYRGRVMSVWLVSILGGVPIGALIGGFLIDTIGAQTTILGFGAAILLYTVVASWRTDAMTSLDDSRIVVESDRRERLRS